MKKIILKGVGILLVLVIVAIAIVISNLDGIVKRSIERYGPQITKVDVKVDAVHIGLMAGSASIKGLVIGNPPGYKAPHAIIIGNASIGIQSSTLLAPKIVVRSVKVESPEITFEGSLGENNLFTIKDNVSGPAEKGQTVTNAVGQTKPEKRFEVDDFAITDAKVNGTLAVAGREISVNNFTLKEIHLTNLGTDPQGITGSELTKKILDELTKKISQELGRLGGNIGKDVLNNLGSTNLNLKDIKKNLNLKNLLQKPGTKTTNSP